MPSSIPVKILGQDDWLVFGRTEDGRLVYTIIEGDWHWLEAPHKGECWNEKTGLNCDGGTMFTCRRDNKFMQDHVAAHASAYLWAEADDWPPEQDAAFTAHAAETYLPKEN